MKFLQIVAFISMMGCSVSEPEQINLRQSVTSDHGVFSVAAEYQELRAGQEGKGSNAVNLVFFDRSGLAASQVEVHDVIPFMPSMGHGTLNLHKFAPVSGSAGRYLVSDLYFNMPSVEGHRWVLKIRASIGGQSDTVDVPISVGNSTERSQDLSGSTNTASSESGALCSGNNRIYSESPGENLTILAKWSAARLSSIDSSRNSVDLTLCQEDTPASWYASFSELELSLFMEMTNGVGHDNLGKDRHSIKVKDSLLTVENLFFVMPSHIESNEEVTAFGRWTLAIRANKDGKEYTWKVVVPDVY
jgi:hypothetical protein